jgi:hypothetical protein
MSARQHVPSRRLSDVLFGFGSGKESLTKLAKGACVLDVVGVRLVILEACR